MIQVKNLYKSYQGSQILKGVHLEIPKGKITIILGSSGQGKTVLLRHLIGLVRPDKGGVWVDGQNIVDLGEEELNLARRKFGMLFQGAALFDSLTVGENVAFPLKEHTTLSASAIEKKVREKLTLVGLEGAVSKMPSELSGGMRKRVGLARAIALEPKIILYDEPTTGLDPVMRGSIGRLIVDMQKQLGVTSVVISHDMPLALAIADKIAMLDDGKIIEEGSPVKIQASQNPKIVAFLKADL